MAWVTPESNQTSRVSVVLAYSSAPLPSSHRFPMAKFRLLQALLLRQGLAEQDQFHQPLPAPRRWLELVHEPRYHQAFARGELTHAEQRRIGLPATTPLVQRTWLAVGGTVLTARLALERGLACHLAGGTHHAFPDHGSGFCIFNDCAVAARVLLAEGLVQQLMVIDLDVHQGDATAGGTARGSPTHDRKIEAGGVSHIPREPARHARERWVGVYHRAGREREGSTSWRQHHRTRNDRVGTAVGGHRASGSGQRQQRGQHQMAHVVP